ncbi:hypothetical protein D3C76_1340570 [compost metagenome]
MGFIAQAAQGKVGPILSDTHAQSGSQLVEAFQNGIEVLAIHAFIQKAVGQGCQARLMGGVSAAGGKADMHVEHGQAGGANEQDLGAGKGLVSLDR